MSLDISTLTSFYVLAETGNFTSAAEKVHISQSAVSQQIAKLEKQLGTQLIVRGKKVKLTEAGEKLLSYARQIISLQQEAIDYFKTPELKGEVKFGLPEDFATVFLAEVLAEYTLQHPLITINVECDLTLNLMSRFKKNEFDLVLVKMANQEDFPHGHEIWQEKLVWVANKSYKRSNLKDQHLPLVLAPKPCVYRARATGALDEARVPWQIRYVSPSHIGCLAAVKAGLGITVLPQNMVPNDLSVIKSSALPDLENTHISLLMKKDVKSAVASFADYVIEHLSARF
jgi:DNA-binding transcriptional LysR family regulator